MLTLQGPIRECRPGIRRRDVLKAGALGMGALALPDLLKLQAQAGAAAGRGKAVIWIWLRGGPSHIDAWDMKPLAPAEVRGEFRPIPTNVPGIEICEHLPRQAAMMDRLAIIRGIKSNDLGDHTPHYILTGFPDRGKRPALGAVVSYLAGRAARAPASATAPAHSTDLPPYVSSFKYSHEASTYTGPQHRPFIPDGAGLANLERRRELSLERLDNRRALLGQLDTLRRDLDASAVFGGLDAYTQRAIEMLTSSRARAAFDLAQEPRENHERYGKYCENLLLARRLVEAGVSVVTVKLGDWDTHEHNFRDMREQLPQLDQGFCALIADLYDRGLQNDVAVVLWGEFGRAPRISRIAGRDHWPEANKRRKAFAGYQVSASLMELAIEGAVFMHCLPARRGEEDTDEVIDGHHSAVVVHASNRMHFQKGLLAWLLHEGK